MLRTAAIAFLVIGTIVGALGGAHLPTACPWIAGTGLLILAAGAAMLRLSRRSSASGETGTGPGGTAGEALETLAKLPAPVAELSENAADLPLDEIRDRIGEISKDYLQPIADAAPSLLLHLGSRDYAEVMSAYATGERLLHRAWSAATDNHRDECLASLSRVGEQLDESVGKLDSLGLTKTA